MGRKRDLKQVDAIAREFGMDADARDGFGKYLGGCKAAGDRGTGNARGDFTYEELRVKARELLGQGD